MQLKCEHCGAFKPAALAELGIKEQPLQSAAHPPTQLAGSPSVEIVEEVLDDWNSSYEHYALSGAPTGSAAKEQVNQFASEVITALRNAAQPSPTTSSSEQARAVDDLLGFLKVTPLKLNEEDAATLSMLMSAIAVGEVPETRDQDSEK